MSKKKAKKPTKQQQELIDLREQVTTLKAEVAEYEAEDIKIGTFRAQLREFLALDLSELKDDIMDDVNDALENAKSDLSDSVEDTARDLIENASVSISV